MSSESVIRFPTIRTGIGTDIFTSAWLSGFKRSGQGVIPAKSGILTLNLQVHDADLEWIPAFSGMT